MEKEEEIIMKRILVFIVFVLFILGCGKEISQSGTGKGGSLARFAILGDYLYTVDDRGLNVFNIGTYTNPVKVNDVPVGFRIETLFAYKNYLYIGSQDGMFIYDASNAEYPKRLASVRHFTACDPVVADDKYAYVTLHSGSNCRGTTNLLEVYDIKDVTNPVLVSRRNLVKPIGLALYGNYLFVCDDEVKIFDVTEPKNAKLVHSINKSTFDIILYNSVIILVGKNGVYQYSLDSSNIKNTKLLSTISI